MSLKVQDVLGSNDEAELLLKMSNYGWGMFLHDVQAQVLDTVRIPEFSLSAIMVKFQADIGPITILVISNEAEQATQFYLMDEENISILSAALTLIERPGLTQDLEDGEFTMRIHGCCGVIQAFENSPKEFRFYPRQDTKE